MAAASPEGSGDAPASGPSASGALGGVAEPAAVVETPALPAVHEVPAYAAEWSSPELQQLVAGKKYADTEQIAQAYQHAVSKLGADPANLVTLPDWEDAEASGKFYNSIGRPEEASGYTMLEGMDAGDQDVATRMVDGIHPLGLTDKQWTGVQKVFQEVGAHGLQTMQERQNVEGVAAETRLKTRWGADYEGNTKLGTQAVAKMQVSNEMLDGIQDKIGYEATMEWALNLSRMVGEQSMNTGPGGGPQQFQMSPQEAQADYDRMKSDPETVAKANAGDRATLDRRERLIEIISSGQGADATLTLR